MDKKVIKGLKTPAFILDKGWKIAGANSSFLSILKSNEKDLINKEVYEIFPSLSGKKKLSEAIEVNIKRKIYLLIPAETEKETFVFLADITKRKKEEEELREKLSLFSSITETSLIGTFIMENEEIIYVNNSLLKIFGCKRENMLGKNSIDFVFREDKKFVRDKIKELQSKKGISFDFRGINYRKKKIINLKVFLSLIDEKKPKIVGTLMDITEEVKAREERRRSHERLNRVYKATIEAFGKTVEARDPYTAGHQVRVAEISVIIGKEMGLEEKRLRTLEESGRIHDIGKIGIPSEILTKPGRLTEEEFALVKRHPVIGYEILKTIPFNLPVAKVVLQHHERMDGSGYPYGLKDGEILIEARILGVADVFEAMVSHRPYRPAWTIDEVMKEMERGKGKKYDREVVSALFKVLKKGNLSFLFSDKNNFPSFY